MTLNGLRRELAELRQQVGALPMSDAHRRRRLTELLARADQRRRDQSLRQGLPVPESILPELDAMSDWQFFDFCQHLRTR